MGELKITINMQQEFWDTMHQLSSAGIVVTRKRKTFALDERISSGSTHLIFQIILKDFLSFSR